MANFLSGFLDNVARSAGNPKGTLGDFSHAARLYNAESFRLSPKVKFLYHVVFNLNPEAVRATRFSIKKHGTALNMLVKAVELPKFKIATEMAQQYNRKRQIQTRLEYDPISVTFHDDNVGITTEMWRLYYEYHFADSRNIRGLQENILKSTNGLSGHFGMDNGQTVPFFTSIQIYQLSRKTYTSFTLMNPVITGWQHDAMDNSSSETVKSSMSIAYESVIYGSGVISEGNPSGFATEYYDKTPSPLGVDGGGAARLFGKGGVVNGMSDVLGAISSGAAFKDPKSFLGTLIKGANTVKNAKKLTPSALQQEGAGLIKQTLGKDVANVAGVASILFPKKSTQSTNVAATSPSENTTKRVTNGAATFSQNFAANPAKYANLAASIAGSANLPGIPKTASGFSSMSPAQQTAAVDKIANEYNNGNPKVVGLVNKYIT